MCCDAVLNLPPIEPPVRASSAGVASKAFGRGHPVGTQSVCVWKHVGRLGVQVE